MGAEPYQVLVDPQADGKLAAHMEFLARVSESAAARLYGAYEEAINFLKERPAACPAYTPQTPFDAELRYKLFGKRYRIVYEIIGGIVYIYDIQDCRQDAGKGFV
jgi:hypothetical protein